MDCLIGEAAGLAGEGDIEPYFTIRKVGAACRSVGVERRAGAVEGYAIDIQRATCEGKAGADDEVTTIEGAVGAAGGGVNGKFYTAADIKSTTCTPVGSRGERRPVLIGSNIISLREDGMGDKNNQEYDEAFFKIIIHGYAVFH